MSDHNGHRHRLIEKMDSGELCDHEYLEALLFSALPRRNTNELAHRLLAEFGSVKGVLSASVERLQKVNGVGEQVAGFLRCVGIFCQRYYTSTERSYPKLFSKEHFPSYVKEEYGRLGHEVLDFYLLDEEQNVLLCKSFSLDDPTRVTINPDEFAALIVANKPSGLVIVHNHLKGTYLPSEMDDRATRQFALICSFHNVFLCDHYIYSPQGVYSYYQSGRLQEIAQEFAICSLVDKKE